MKLGSLAFISSLANLVFANNLELLSKRDHGLPYSSLPATSCSVPASCSNIGPNVTCHCNDVITICVNSNNQYCWGSKTLTSTSCPAVPTSCSSTLTGSEKNCLCNSNNVLCVDNANNYCYGAISGSSVSIEAIPVSPTSSTATTAGASSSSLPTSQSGANASPSASSTVNPSPTSGSSLLIPTSYAFALACVLAVGSNF
ncbi:hypothetical protein BY458DRAFT_496565 [Sporodiniella umbellata]|nr:hypothetical protein BY458DRAFT_496565 [Sporodiniella umbellata]